MGCSRKKESQMGGTKLSSAVCREFPLFSNYIFIYHCFCSSYQDTSAIITPLLSNNVSTFFSLSTAEPTGSDLVLEAVLEAEVANNAKIFVLQPPPDLVPKE
jgi:hypothetical protein